MHTPLPTDSSNEGLNNNPAITFARKNKPNTVIQHPEWARGYCDRPGCNRMNCLNLCSEKVSEKSVGHFTHSDKEELNPQKLSDTDFDGKPREVYVVQYKIPHDTSSQAYNPESDRQKTEAFHKMLKYISKDDRGT